MLLAIDTSAGSSVAIVDRDRGTIVELGEADTRRHAEVIGTLIALALAESGVSIPELSGVAVGMGPGPFTGLRVGIAAAQAFAFGAGKPVVRVVSHDAVAWGHYAAGNTGPLLVVTDARRREVYWSTYSGADEFGLPERSRGPAIESPAGLETLGLDGHARIDAAEVSAASAGLLAEGLFQHRRAFAGPEALYLRAPDVTVSAGPKRVS
ncbi:tRNA (adenosine(37)-N6)-threonylcarbamoyltransferase complex dimerization subunit type 1 TsaB [Lacisediminihabitans profunda]|uniref:tRNA (Adenosine(37)-N6)-threonylcarbamoyltransferase complex dimerization subunit type 1 TsaB n=1 Tax=Lacisediminihabitans profunda TaxID=2594790 RepID=A0A5C8URP3_9MICO|nr:tRNA (adenosine(37)-N6)-threonylcarbamoyltransferase complex dimerization subunit type 1 TsaB [Lacisediminihabitans profunda]TXN30256.1 tRNA (adenosine(37)-N6)-threonylcarbamoyltransferase complex dimerization subunit type 1 TsaB [Lacisediminihabitans profunda]